MPVITLERGKFPNGGFSLALKMAKNIGCFRVREKQRGKIYPDSSGQFKDMLRAADADGRRDVEKRREYLCAFFEASKAIEMDRN